ncbi:hypothetical protein F4802DRAFT_611504 [Xylaria palmicola]|nr:hypothetical protein F4802DRAFT_611504 [Xylaria palmicola]
MAVIKRVPGLEVYVEVAGKRLKEYDVSQGANDIHQPPLRKRRKWDFTQPYRSCAIENGYVAKCIAVESGTYPCVQFIKTPDCPKEGHHIAYSVEFDDVELKLRHQPPGAAYEDYWEDSIDSAVVGTERIQVSQRFRFADLACVDTNDSKGYTKSSRVGIIQVSVYHMEEHRLLEDRDFDCDRVECHTIMTKDAMNGRNFSHCLMVEDGEKIDNPEIEYCDDMLDGDCRPFAVYEFYYRSRDVLSTQGILPPRELEPKIKEEIKGRREYNIEVIEVEEIELKQLEKESQQLQQRITLKQMEIQARQLQQKIDMKKMEIQAENMVGWASSTINKKRRIEVVDLTGSP